MAVSSVYFLSPVIWSQLVELQYFFHMADVPVEIRLQLTPLFLVVFIFLRGVPKTTHLALDLSLQLHEGKLAFRFAHLYRHLETIEIHSP